MFNFADALAVSLGVDNASDLTGLPIHVILRDDVVRCYYVGCANANDACLFIVVDTPSTPHTVFSWHAIDGLCLIEEV